MKAEASTTRMPLSISFMATLYDWYGSWIDVRHYSDRWQLFIHRIGQASVTPESDVPA
jgi:hypothetical protein